MNPVIFNITMRQLLGRKRVLLMAGFAMLPVFVAALVRLTHDSTLDQQQFTANVVLDGLVVTTLLPLVALVFGTAVLGAEIDDGTAVYLLAQPEPRWRILTTKLVVAWLCTMVTVLVSAVAAGAVAISGSSDSGIVEGFALAVVLGSFVYSCLFVMLSVMTSRALIVGLLYTFLWEGLITGLFKGTRFFSVHEYSIGVADMVARVSRDTFHARMEGSTALVLMLVMSAAALYVGIRRLERFEIGETS